jgi:adenosylmethionine-8-amino-7-oxononanoate aminotransferase
MPRCWTRWACRPRPDERFNFLKENNARSVWHPMAHPAEMPGPSAHHRHRRQGVRITDVDGHEVVDGVGGLVERQPRLFLRADQEAPSPSSSTGCPIYSTFRGTTNDAVIELAEELRDFFGPDGMPAPSSPPAGPTASRPRCGWRGNTTRSGARPGRTKFLSLKKGYHGTHFGGASVNGNANFRTAYEPLLAGCFHIPAPYTYRNPSTRPTPSGWRS